MDVNFPVLVGAPLEQAVRESPWLERTERPEKRWSEQRAEEHDGGEISEDFGDLFQAGGRYCVAKANALH